MEIVLGLAIARLTRGDGPAAVALGIVVPG